MIPNTELLNGTFLYIGADTDISPVRQASQKGFTHFTYISLKAFQEDLAAKISNEWQIGSSDINTESGFCSRTNLLFRALTFTLPADINPDQPTVQILEIKGCGYKVFWKLHDHYPNFSPKGAAVIYHGLFTPPDDALELTNIYLLHERLWGQNLPMPKLTIQRSIYADDQNSDRFPIGQYNDSATITVLESCPREQQRVIRTAVLGN